MSRNNTYDVLTYEQFQLEILEAIQDQLDEDYKVEITRVIKNNSVALVAIVINHQSDYITPNIYLEDFYDYYLNGIRIKNIVNIIIESHFNLLKKGMKDIKHFDYQWDCIKDKVFYSVVNIDKNLRLLERVPHLIYLDLAIIFNYLVGDRKDGISVVKITKDHIKEWGIKLIELRDRAMKNTPRLFPVDIRNMNDVISEILTEDWVNKEKDYSMYDPANQCPEDILLDLLGNDRQEDTPMYVLSNTKGINGASCILYKEVINDFANKLDSDIYILPSSIHEVILVKDDNLVSKNDLIEMVMEVNKHEVGEEDYLSNKVYHYSRYTKMITL